MNGELIKIENRDGLDTVNARELHKFLEVGKDFTTWLKDRVEKYGFFENQDYMVLVFPNSGEKGGRPLTEYFLTIEMGKELSMIENNEKGRQARKYFIEAEKTLREMSRLQIPTGSNLLALAVLEAQKQLGQKDAIIESMKPAAQFMADVTGSKDAIEMSQVAKIIDMGYGRNQLFDLLREKGVLRHNNEPYQTYIDKGWFRLVEQSWKDSKGETHISIKPIVYQKGIDGIIKIIRAQK